MRKCSHVEVLFIILIIFILKLLVPGRFIHERLAREVDAVETLGREISYYGAVAAAERALSCFGNT